MGAADQVLTVVLSVISVLVGYGGKMAQDWWTARREQQQADRALWSLQRQQFHLPLLAAARELEARLSELAAVYRGTSRRDFTLQGPGGAGIFLEQQESIAEMMLDPDGRVLSHFDFRRRLLELPGWEQFTALFLFYISDDDRLDGAPGRARFVAKVPHEVQATTDALGRLDARLAEICARSSGSRA